MESLDRAMRETLREEYRQVWEHYRHVENARDQRLEYFFTITLAVLGFSIAISGTGLSRGSQLLAICSSIHVYIWIVIHLHLSVTQLSLVLGHYLNAMHTLRNYFFRDESAETRHLAYEVNVETNKNIRPLFTSPYYGIHDNSRNLILALVYVGLFAELGIVVGALTLRATDEMIQLVVLGVEATLSILGIIVWLLALRSVAAVPTDDELRYRLPLD